MDEALPSPPSNHRVMPPRLPDPLDVPAACSAKADFWIKLVQKLGFPVVVAGVCLWIGKDLIDDYRENLKANTKSAIVNAEANHMNAESGKQQTAIMDRINNSQNLTHQKIDMMTEWQRRSVHEQQKTNQLLQNSRIKVSNGPDDSGATPDPMH